MMVFSMSGGLVSLRWRVFGEVISLVLTSSTAPPCWSTVAWVDKDGIRKRCGAWGDEKVMSKCYSHRTGQFCADFTDHHLSYSDERRTFENEV